MGIQEEGLADVVSGLLSGSFSLGGGVGPLLGGVLANWFGFQWSAAAFGALLGATGLAVCIVGLLRVRSVHSMHSGQSRPDEGDSVRSVPSITTRRAPGVHVVTPMSPRPPLMSSASGHRHPHHAFANGNLHEPLLGQTHAAGGERVEV